VIFHSHSIDLTVELSETVVEHLSEQRQVSNKGTESGGQVFGQIHRNWWTIQACSGPRPSDRRSSHGYSPDSNVENSEILSMYEKGFHFLGDWHTHPQKKPSASHQDIEVTQRCYRKSKTDLPGFLLIIVGSTFPDQPCCVIFSSDKNVHELSIANNQPIIINGELT